MDFVNQLWLLKQIYNQDSKYDDEHNALVHNIPSTITKAELEQLTACGHAPNHFVKPNHDEVLSELKQLAQRWTLEEAAQAFVASLWSAPIIWRSLLVGKLIATVIPDHEYNPYPSSGRCQICGIDTVCSVDTSLQWYWLMTNGTPLDGNPFGCMLALRELANEDMVPNPTEYDRWTFRALLTVIRSLPPETRYSKAAPILKKAALLPTKNKFAYSDLLETLALIGLLDTEDYPGMATSFTSYKKRDERPNTRVEVQAPLAWWNSSIGINNGTLTSIFKQYDSSDVVLENHPQPQPEVKHTLIGALEQKRLPTVKAPKSSPDAGKGPAEAGDVYAIRIREGVWITVYCHETKNNRVTVEFLDGVTEEMPTKENLKLQFRPCENERRHTSVASIDSTSWVRRVARNMTCPSSTLPAPNAVSFANAKDLKYLAGWSFPEI
ncbi:hypothetical protein ABE099_02615 [Paenibacillus turicensis]|uniref:hypothetical protein n=1 Tax=Paenibacillus turicensis TaxID=160487 RepID=UPI003D28656F